MNAILIMVGVVTTVPILMVAIHVRVLVDMNLRIMSTAALVYQYNDIGIIIYCIRYQ